MTSDFSFNEDLEEHIYEDFEENANALITVGIFILFPNHSDLVCDNLSVHLNLILTSRLGLNKKILGFSNHHINVKIDTSCV